MYVPVWLQLRCAVLGAKVLSALFSRWSLQSTADTATPTLQCQSAVLSAGDQSPCCQYRTHPSYII